MSTNEPDVAAREMRDRRHWSRRLCSGLWRGTPPLGGSARAARWMQKRPLGAILLLVFLMLLQGGFSPASAQEKRLALVVAISNYETLPRLRNTLEDAILIERTLKALNFQVKRLSDPSMQEIREALRSFAFHAETADVALFYFGGHGMEVGGANFLVPADSRARNRQEIADTSFTLAEVLAAVDKARQLRLVVLDSCRDDPFLEPGKADSLTVTVSADAGGGLAEPSPERGVLVAYAAKAGAVAYDGGGNNSPFALALAEHMKAADLEIGLMFRQVRDSVLRATGNRQEPHTYGSLPGNPYFLAGRSQETNLLANDERRNAWALVSPDQLKQLEALAAEGDARALKGMAYMRLNPDEARYDPQEGAMLLEKAASADDPEAMFELGRLLEQGLGIDQDIPRALKLYRAAAELDFADAINDLGFLYFQGGVGVPRDTERAITFFAQAADLRQPEAMFNYAALIDDGLVAGKSPKDAGRYLYDALRSGNEDVLRQLSENPNMFKAETRRALQEMLAEVRMYDGPIDGDFGPATKRSLRQAYGTAEAD